MKSVLLFAPDLAGHFNQLFILAENLRQRGLRVAMASGETAERLAQRLDVPFYFWELKASTEKNRTLLLEIDRLTKAAAKDSNPVILHKETLDLERELYPLLYDSAETIIKQYSPDIVLADFMAYAAIDAATNMNIPCIRFSRYLGDLVPTKLCYPRFPLPYTCTMTSKELLLNALLPVLHQLFIYNARRKFQNIRKTTAQQKGCAKVSNTQVTFVSTPIGFDLPRRLPSYIIMTGPILRNNVQKIPEELERWLQSSQEKPVLYVSFGTVAAMSSTHINSVAAALKSSAFSVLWSLPKEQQKLITHLPDNVRVESRVPQTSILRHSKVRLFITHGGMNSITESLAAGVPMLAVPLFWDQPFNSARLVDLGVGIRVLKSELTSEKLATAIEHMLSTEKYAKHAQKVSDWQTVFAGNNRACQLIENILEVGYDFLLPERV